MATTQTSSPFSTLAASQRYSHGVTRGATTRNIGAASLGPGEVQGFRPGETSPGAFALKMASTLMGSGQRLGAQRAAQEQEAQANYARQLNLARLEQQTDPNYMTAFQRGSLDQRAANATDLAGSRRETADWRDRSLTEREQHDRDTEKAAQDRIHAGNLARERVHSIAALSAFDRETREKMAARIEELATPHVQHAYEVRNSALQSVNRNLQRDALRDLGLKDVDPSDMKPGELRTAVDAAIQKSIADAREAAKGQASGEFKSQRDYIDAQQAKILRDSDLDTYGEWNDENHPTAPVTPGPPSSGAGSAQPAPGPVAPAAKPTSYSAAQARLPQPGSAGSTPPTPRPGVPIYRQPYTDRRIDTTPFDGTIPGQDPSAAVRLAQASAPASSTAPGQQP